MDNGMIRKYEKAKMYAEQPDRVVFKSIVVEFDGKNSPHSVVLKDGKWQCDCDFFHARGRCSHTMALEMMLKDMLPDIVYE
ncbi:MAG: hypothetical protein JXA19_03860 [Anaerolineales bacterium]|nr:hypothetical protein [Anaerolineales bacterium]